MRWRVALTGAERQARWRARHAGVPRVTVRQQRDQAREATVTLACAVLDARTLDEAQAAALAALGRGQSTDKGE